MPNHFFCWWNVTKLKFITQNLLFYTYFKLNIYRQNHMLKPLWRLQLRNLSISEIFQQQIRIQFSQKGKFNWWKKHLPRVLQSHWLAFTQLAVEVETLNHFGKVFVSFFTETNMRHHESFERFWREDNRGRTTLKLFMMMSKKTEFSF